MSINHAENEQLHDKYTRFYDNGKHRITALSLTNKGIITNAEVTFSHDDKITVNPFNKVKYISKTDISNVNAVSANTILQLLTTAH